jgi:hypothetical protein
MRCKQSVPAMQMHQCMVWQLYQLYALQPQPGREGRAYREVNPELASAMMRTSEPVSRTLRLLDEGSCLRDCASCP